MCNFHCCACNFVFCCEVRYIEIRSLSSARDNGVRSWCGLYVVLQILYLQAAVMVWVTTTLVKKLFFGTLTAAEVEVCLS